MVFVASAAFWAYWGIEEIAVGMESLAYGAFGACPACVVFQETVASGTEMKATGRAATFLLVHLVENSIEVTEELATAESWQRPVTLHLSLHRHPRGHWLPLRFQDRSRS